MADINTNYDQFYKGTSKIENYGSAPGKKDTVVNYEFNTTDEKGNKVMDKMSREETMRAVNEISSRYGDNVIVEFSGDGMAALADHKMMMDFTEDHREIPEWMITHLEGPEPLTADRLRMIDQKEGDDDEALMRRIDPDAYEEYLAVKKAGIETGGQEGMVAGARYMLNWITRNAQKNPERMDKERETQRALDLLSKKYPNADISIGDKSEVKLRRGSRPFGIVISKDELEIIKYGSDDEKEKIYKLIEDSIKKRAEIAGKQRKHKNFTKIISTHP